MHSVVGAAIYSVTSLFFYYSLRTNITLLQELKRSLTLPLLHTFPSSLDKTAGDKKDYDQTNDDADTDRNIQHKPTFVIRGSRSFRGKV